MPLRVSAGHMAQAGEAGEAGLKAFRHCFGTQESHAAKKPAAIFVYYMRGRK